MTPFYSRGREPAGNLKQPRQILRWLAPAAFKENLNYPNVAARRSHSRVVLAGFDYESSWRVPSWDGFHLPKPFSRVHLRIVQVGAEEMEDRDEAARRLGARLAEINPDRRPAPVRSRG